MDNNRTPLYRFINTPPAVLSHLLRLLRVCLAPALPLRQPTDEIWYILRDLPWPSIGATQLLDLLFLRE